MLLGTSLGMNLQCGGVRAAPAIVAPSLVGVTACVTGASGVTRTTDYSPLILKNGDTLYTVCQSRAAGTNTTTPPAGEGWTLIASSRLSGHTLDVYRKFWGQGNTDTSRQTSVFTFQTGGATLAATTFVMRNVPLTGESQVSAVQSNGSSSTVATPLSASAPAATDVTVWIAASTDDNAINAPSQGTLGFGGASYNSGATGSMAMAYSAPGWASHVSSCNFTESTNGPDSSFGLTLVIPGMVPVSDGLTLWQFANAAYTKSRTNAVGWTSPVVSDLLIRSGFYYRYAGCVNLDKSITLVCQRATNPAGPWTNYSTFTSAPIADPAGISNWPSDAHFAITLGVSKLGRLHVLFQAHGLESAMQYGRGTGPGDVTISFGAWTGGVADASYAQLFNVADGTCLVSYRVGAAGGQAQQVLYEENQDENGWTLITLAINNFTDGTGDDESMYMQRMLPDPARDELHVSWCWAKSNTSSSYHGVMYVKGKRTGVATWTWAAMDGSAITLPVLDTTTSCIVDSATTTTPVCVHNGMGFDPATGYPLIPYLKAHTTTHGGGTDMIVATWNGSAFVRNIVALIHPTWDMIGAPPNPERAVVRGADVFKVGGTIYLIYTSDIELSTSGVSCLMKRTSTDGGATWSASSRMADLPFAGNVVRIDANGFYVFGRITVYFQILDDDDGVFLLNTASPAAILDIAA